MKRSRLFIATLDELSEKYERETGERFCTYRSAGKLLSACNAKVDAFLRANGNITVQGVSHDLKEHIASIVLVYDAE